MINSITKPKKTTIFISLIQLILLFIYLGLNIQNVGSFGVALPLLVGFVAIGSFTVFNQLIRSNLVVRLNFFVFLLLTGWLAVRVIVDLGDMERLKALTVATTGGILLFSLLGCFARQVMDNLNEMKHSRLPIKLILLLFFFVSLALFISFKKRLIRTDIFYIEGVEGGYQRPGNFLIMLFIMASFAYLALAAHPLTKSILRFFAWLFIYTLGFALALISSQMIGSNAATANLLAIYMMTCVIGFVALNRNIRIRFSQGRVALPLSKITFKRMSIYSAVTLITTLFLAVIAIQITGFDLSKTNVFGFGSGSNISLSSRIDILLETGTAQLSYAPFLGNLNVAEITTGSAGRTLHNFFPNVMAELGLVGLLLVLAILFLNFKNIIEKTKKAPVSSEGFKIAILNFWLIFIFFWLIFYVNIAVGKSWPVWWFFIGFSVSFFATKKQENSKCGLSRCVSKYYKNELLEGTL